MARFIAATFADRAQADRVIYALKEAGIASGNISLLARERASEDIRYRDQEEDSPFTGLAVSAAWDRVGWQVGGLPEFRTQDSDLADFDSHTVGVKVLVPLFKFLGESQEFEIGVDRTSRSDDLDSTSLSAGWQWRF